MAEPTDSDIEAVAMALFKKEWLTESGWTWEMETNKIMRQYWFDSARAAIAALVERGWKAP